MPSDVSAQTTFFTSVSTRSYDDRQIEANTTCSATSEDSQKMCTYAERLAGENIATRSSRVMNLESVSAHEKLYTGDIDGDGIEDRYIENTDINGQGPGIVEFGLAAGGYTTVVPSRFRNAAGELITLGAKTTAAHPYDSSTSRFKTTSIDVFADTRREVGQSKYLLVSVSVLADNGERFNIDQCSPK